MILVDEGLFVGKRACAVLLFKQIAKVGNGVKARAFGNFAYAFIGKGEHIGGGFQLDLV